MRKNLHKPQIGFIGQGWIGKNYADDFERRGFRVVRYARSEPLNGNAKEIAKCDIVFIAVPTPTTPKGFDASVLRKVVKLVGKGKIAVIKSTILPSTTKDIQKENPDIYVMHSPEFLSEATAKHDAAHPDRNIIGIPEDTPTFRKRARDVLAVLPKAPYSLICSAEEAEVIKYAHNISGFFQIILFNALYDFSSAHGADWDILKKSFLADDLMMNRGHTYMDPIHKSGRGAGGDCFIKDFAAFARAYAKKTKDPLGSALLRALEKKNIALLKKSKKDLDLLRGVYGDTV